MGGGVLRRVNSLYIVLKRERVLGVGGIVRRLVVRVEGRVEEGVEK